MISLIQNKNTVHLILSLSSRDWSSKTFCMLRLNLGCILNIWKIFEVTQTVVGLMWVVVICAVLHW